ncbi:hypothetical protein F4560_004284 [Saccharothrix ecbatanensis]|uniref:Uncharacterized protein n=1 Tax=Saccharothrix ecbatanensis TaxID=1105145 RepID=A0A7W9HM33_9PSEU|nr:hypothetical protein [Saccharothrix ecbatanensis]MBB5804516.1 hypothetical protein [Saccharothrix ecbatanensis]
MADVELPHDLEVIVDSSDLAEALVKAFVNADAATRQHIVDTLGDRSRNRRP